MAKLIYSSTGYRNNLRRRIGEFSKEVREYKNSLSTEQRISLDFKRLNYSV